MEKTCYIISAGDVYPTKLTAGAEDFIICADGGYEHRELLGREPDLVVGDFDSLGRPPLRDNVLLAPREKDETDTMLALNEGLKRGYRRFVLFGALGGSRFDHSVANLQLLSYLCQRGAQGYIVDKDRILTAIKDSSVSFDEEERGYISVFSLTDKSEGVYIKNLRYELENAVLSAFCPMGVSNEFTGKAAYIRVEKGILLITWCSRGKNIVEPD